MVMIEAVRDLDDLVLHVNALDVTLEESAAAQELANRIDNRREVQVAGGDLMQHGREQEEVIAIYQGDFEVAGALQSLFQFKSDVQAGEAAAKNHNVLLPVHERLRLAEIGNFAVNLDVAVAGE